MKLTAACLALLALVANLAEATPVKKATTGLQTSCTPIVAGYFRSWRDTAASTSNPAGSEMSTIPAGVDIAIVFPEGDEAPAFWTALKDKYVASLHAQNTKVVQSINIQIVLSENVGQSYAARAQALYDKYVGQWGLDGLDIDMESSLSSAQVTDAAGVINELAKIIGPLSNKPGSLLIYDTNLDNHPLFPKIAPGVSYLLRQAYGASTQTLQNCWNSYAADISSCQYLVGFSFYEERGFNWGDTSKPFDTSRAGVYTAWQPTGGKKGGVFSYALDRDWKAVGDDTLSAPTYEFTKDIIAKKSA